MGKAARKSDKGQGENAQVLLPIAALVFTLRRGLREFVVESGMKVLGELLEQERTEFCGPRYKHEPERAAHRAGHATGELAMGGRRVQVRRPRARTDERELELPTWKQFSSDDPLNARALEEMVIGVSTRKYRRALEDLPPEVKERGTSKSAVSRRFVMQMATWKDGCKPTRYPGIYRTETGYRVRVRAVDPRTGMQKERNEDFPNLTIEQALAKKAELRRDIEKGGAVGERMRVGEFARYWIECKAGTIDRKTAEHYADALDNHALPHLGKLYFDTIRSMDVQGWINAELRKGYRVATVHSYFRAFRVMVRDAIVQLDLPRDPTMRITFPDRGEREEANALTPEQLARFLGEVRTRHPRHYALVATLAYRGLRFCHASALRWEDIDEETGIIRINRKQNRGHVAPVSRKKRAPKEYPLDPVLAEILRQHRSQMGREAGPGPRDGICLPVQVGHASDTEWPL